MASFFRYPGGKTKLKLHIINKLNEIINNNFPNQKFTYMEPFFGGGSIGLELLKTNKDIQSCHINDRDKSLADLWHLVTYNPQLLINEVANFIPTTQSFYQFKQDLLNGEINGFKKLAIHQMSYSGLGTKAGGPIGGESQSSNYKVDCRWSKQNIIKKITTIAKLLYSHNAIITSYDFEDLINISYNSPTSPASPTSPTLIYLDPPYFDKGSQLYQFSFSEQDHIRLANSLKNTKHHWLLSYDDSKEIRELYNWANIQELNVNYSIRNAQQKQELLISK